MNVIDNDIQHSNQPIPLCCFHVVVPIHRKGYKVFKLLWRCMSHELITFTLARGSMSRILILMRVYYTTACSCALSFTSLLNVLFAGSHTHVQGTWVLRSYEIINGNVQYAQQVSLYLG